MRAQPAARIAPRSREEVQRLVRSVAGSGLTVKAIGSGHSFTGAAASDGVMVSLSRMGHGLEVDTASSQVVAPAGIPIGELNRRLATHGLALPNLGDIDRQSISGAIATGTHGTGAGFPGLAAQVVGVTAVLADGSVVTCSATEQPELFACLQLGLGAFGVITDVRLQCVPAFSLQAEEVVHDLEQILDDVDDWVDGSDHAEFFWFPHSSHAITKRNTRGPVGPRQSRRERVGDWVNDELVSNVVLETLCRVEARRPELVPRLNAMKGRLLSDRTYADDSYRVYTTRRRVVFREMEYAIPRAHVVDIVREIDEWTRRHRAAVNIPVEVRWAAADDVWLSTAHRRPSAYIAVHQHERLPWQGFFAAVEAMVRAVDGRPHWGKMHTLTREDLMGRYPRMPDVIGVRDEVDPTGVFANAYTDRVLGPPPRARRTPAVDGETRWT